MTPEVRKSEKVYNSFINIVQYHIHKAINLDVILNRVYIANIKFLS